MEKTIKVSDGKSVCNFNFTINFINSIEETKERKEKKQDATLAHVPIHPVTRTDNYADLKQKFENHINDQRYFQMTHNPRGKLIVMNNYFINTNEKERHGSDVDVQHIKEVFTELSGKNAHVSIDENPNKTAEEMKAFLEIYAKSEKVVSFIVVVIMSHGTDDMIIGCDSSRLNAMDVVDIFKKDHLKKIPILFFFQMCRGGLRGKAVDQGIQNVGEHADGGHDIGDFREMLKRILPKGKFIDEDNDEPDARTGDYVEGEPNMLVSFSTSENSVSLRNVERGSWFIEELYKKMKDKVCKRDEINVIDLMKEVHIAVNVRRSDTPEFHNIVIAPETAHTLQKKLCFYPGLP